MGGFNVPKKGNYKSLAFTLMVSQGVGEDDDKVFGFSFGMFLMSAMNSADFRMAAEDAF